MRKKIYNLSELSKIIKNLKDKGKKISLCHGVFDLVHLGHVKHLQVAKSYCDFLLVTITSDEFVNKGPSKPLFKEINRADFLASISFVDFVFINKDESSEKIHSKCSILGLSSEVSLHCVALALISIIIS